MATEHEHPDTQISTANATTDPPEDPPPLENPISTAAPPKRHRRPSVRLGEIGGDPSYDAPQRRPNKTLRYHKDPSFAAKSSKTRPLTNLVNGGAGAADSNFQDSVELSDNYKPKIRKPARRARTNWNNKFDSSTANNGGAGVIESTGFFHEENEINNQELHGEGSESPMLKDGPINSGEKMGLQFWDHHRRGSRGRVSKINGVHLNEVNSQEKNNEGNSNSGVREWLSGLGLGRYAHVFEIHEVDDDVLPLLTLEDLKDMGINAVGSRRKMYSSILKLRKGFS